MKFYVYVHYRPDGRPFYVGKGTGKRYKVSLQPNSITQKRNPILRRVTQKILNSGRTVDTKIIARFETEEEAFTLECLLIKQLGRIDLKTGSLANMTAGGDGLAGLSPETKAKQFRFKPGQTYTPERNAKVSAWLTGRPKPPEHRAKLADSLKNNIEVIERLRRQAGNGAGRVQSPEERARRSAVAKGRVFTPEHLAAVRAAAAARPSRKGIPKSEETKARMSAGARARWARDRTPRGVKGPDGKFVPKETL